MSGASITSYRFSSERQRKVWLHYVPFVFFLIMRLGYYLILEFSVEPQLKGRSSVWANLSQLLYGATLSGMGTMAYLIRQYRQPNQSNKPFYRSLLLTQFSLIFFALGGSGLTVYLNAESEKVTYNLYFLTSMFPGFLAYMGQQSMLGRYSPDKPDARMWQVASINAAGNVMLLLFSIMKIGENKQASLGYASIISNMIQLACTISFLFWNNKKNGMQKLDRQSSDDSRKLLLDSEGSNKERGTQSDNELENIEVQQQYSAAMMAVRAQLASTGLPVLEVITRMIWFSVLLQAGNQTEIDFYGSLLRFTTVMSATLTALATVGNLLLPHMKNHSVWQMAKQLTRLGRPTEYQTGASLQDGRKIAGHIQEQIPVVKQHIKRIYQMGWGSMGTASVLIMGLALINNVRDALLGEQVTAELPFSQQYAGILFALVANLLDFTRSNENKIAYGQQDYFTPLIGAGFFMGMCGLSLVPALQTANRLNLLATGGFFANALVLALVRRHRFSKAQALADRWLPTSLGGVSPVPLQQEGSDDGSPVPPSQYECDFQEPLSPVGKGPNYI